MENLDQNVKEIAFVIDGKVVEVTQSDTRFASILLSKPLALDVTGLQVTPGYEYNYQTEKLYAMLPKEVTPHMQAHFGNELPIVNNGPTPCGGGPTPCGCGQQN